MVRAQSLCTIHWYLTVAARKGAKMAGRNGPPVWLRNGRLARHAGGGMLKKLPYGNRTSVTAAGGALMICEVPA